MPRLAAVPWWAWIALAALLARLGFLFGADEPLLYAHPYNYFHGALSIVEHDDSWRFVLTRDNWHTWLGPWTIAPLYYLFLAFLMVVFGPHLLPIQLVQVALDALAAVLTGWLGRRVAGSRGVWAGAVYAVNFHAVEQAPITLTENIHTVLLLAGVVLLVQEAAPSAPEGAGPLLRRGWPRLVLGGFLIGLSALARSVSAAFVPLAAAWRWWFGGGRDGLLRGALIALGAAAAIAPWTVRNALVTGDFIPIETNGIYNFYDDNTFVEGQRRLGQEAMIGAQPTLKQRRQLAMDFALRGIARHPDLFVEKAWRNLLHLVRPDGLQVLLVVEDPMPAWRKALLVVLDDLIVLPTLVLFSVYLLAGRPTPAWGAIAAWSAYYLFMIVVVFHNEIRYRSTLLPFALAGAAGGWSILRDRAAPKWRVRMALALSGALVALVVAPYVVPALYALRSLPPLASMEAAVLRGDTTEAAKWAAEAARADPLAARPLLRYGRALAHADRAGPALEAFERARDRRAHVWVPVVVRPALFAATGRREDAARAVAEANALSHHLDAWLALEAAWRHLPAPLADEVRLGAGDYGAARGFTLPRRDGRWTRHRAWLRLRPATPAAAYDVTLWMGSPEPSPLSTAEVMVRAGGAERHRFTVTRDLAAFQVRGVVSQEGVLLVRIDAPTWNAGREPAEQGVKLTRMAVRPAASVAVGAQRLSGASAAP